MGSSGLRGWCRALVQSERHSLHARPDAELRKHVLDVRRHRLRADHEPVGDVVGRDSVGEQRQDFALSGRQGIEPARRGGRAVPVPVPVAVRMAPRDAADPGQELRRVERLRKVIVGAEEEAGRPVEAFGALDGDEDDPELGVEQLAEPLADLLAVEPREVDVEHDNGRPLLSGGLHCRSTVIEREYAVARLFEEVSKEVAEARVIVDDEDRFGVDHRVKLVSTLTSARPT